MDAAHDAGINFFDTANVYGWGENRGRTEEIVGTWFASGGGRRERTVIATKLYGDMPLAGRDVWPNNGKLSALNIRRALDASLKRLQTDYIDLYQMHHIDRATPWDEVWQAMETAVAQGKILYVGSSNFAGWHIAQAQEAAAAPALHRPGQRAVDLQPAGPRHRARGHPGRAALRPRADPVVAAAGRPARRRADQGRRGRTPARQPGQGLPGQEPRRHRGVREPGPRPGRPARRARPGLAAAPAGGDRADRRSADRRAARRRAQGRRPGARPGARSTGSTSCSRATRPHRRTTPGRPGPSR